MKTFVALWIDLWEELLSVFLHDEKSFSSIIGLPTSSEDKSVSIYNYTKSSNLNDILRITTKRRIPNLSFWTFVYLLNIVWSGIIIIWVLLSKIFYQPSGYAYDE